MRPFGIAVATLVLVSVPVTSFGQCDLIERARRALSVQDDVLLVGAYTADSTVTNAGAVHVYVAPQFSLAHTLQAPVPEQSGFYGASVAQTSRIAYIGASGISPFDGQVHVVSPAPCSGFPYCSSPPNSTGQSAELLALTNGQHDDMDFQMFASGMPVQSWASSWSGRAKGR